MHTFERKLSVAWPARTWQDHTVLLAVSGGADSVAMLCAACRLREMGTGRLIVGHFNHGLRGADADADEQFVRQLADRWQLPVFVDQGSGGSSEDEFRKARYEFLQRTAEQQGARIVATAHTADDQVETILHRILRGTGIAGLAGIRRSRSLGEFAILVRPMLGTTREEVLNYLGSLNQPYCTDKTNASLDYTRNRLRNELLPLLAREYNPNIGDALLRLGQLAADTQSLIEQLLQEAMERHVSIASPTQVTINCGAFTTANRSLLRELLTRIWKHQRWPLRDMGFEEWERLTSLALTNSAAGTLDFPGQLRAKKEGASLSLTRLL